MRKIIGTIAAIALIATLGVVAGSATPASADSPASYWHEIHCEVERQYLENADISTWYAKSYVQWSHTYVPLFGTLVPTFLCVYWVGVPGSFVPLLEDCLRGWLGGPGGSISRWTREDNYPTNGDCTHVNGNNF